MRRKIPSTAALTAFEAAARHQSYTKAALELAVTQSAVCRQVGSLEEFLGVRLFVPSRRGVALTEAGRRYASQIARRLEEVERDTRELMAQGPSGVSLEIATVPTFATRWLLPRLHRFARRCPHIQVNLSSRTAPFLFDGTPFDAAIHAGVAAWPGTAEATLMRESLIAVAAESTSHHISTAGDQDWSAFTLLQQSTRPYAWREWFTAQGLLVDGDLRGPRFELFSMALEAARSGLGIALVPRILAERELAQGTLLQVSPYIYQGTRSYRLLFPEQHASNPALMFFRAWLVDEAKSAKDGAGNCLIAGATK